MKSQVMIGLDFVALSNSFEAWMLSQQAVRSPDNHVVAIDGKRIHQLLMDENGKQRLVGLVSFFAVEAGLSVKLERLTQQDNNEQKVAQNYHVSGNDWCASMGGENRLHQPKAVVFGEDDHRLEDQQALLNWSLFRTIAINVLRFNGFQSLKTALTKLANRVDMIFPLLI